MLVRGGGFFSKILCENPNASEEEDEDTTTAKDTAASTYLTQIDSPSARTPGKKATREDNGQDTARNPSPGPSAPPVYKDEALNLLQQMIGSSAISEENKVKLFLAYSTPGATPKPPASPAPQRIIQSCGGRNVIAADYV